MEQYEDEKNICPYCGYIEGTATEQALHMKPGSILQERYIVGTALGYGGFGVTYIAWDALLEQKVAIKEYLPSEFSTRMPGGTQITIYTGDKSKQFYAGLDRFMDEARRLANLQDVDGIVHIYNCFEENNTAYIIMEYLEGETLAQLLKKERKYSPEEAISMLLPVIDSLATVHEHGIIHRDIAPDNIFITKNGTVKIIDFGAARYETTSHSRSLTVIIKPGYSPEEQYRSKSDQGSHTDVYALAATLYKMITGKTPPDALERRAFFENKRKDILKPLSVYCTSIETNHENAILNAMNVRIEDRTPTMAAFKAELTSTAPVKRVAGKIRKIDLLRWPLWAKIAIPITACMVITLGILFGTGVIGFESDLQSDIVIPDGMTRVPSVVNDTLEAADERLNESILLYKITGKDYSNDIPADYILTQDISAGTVVVQNSIVNITVSGGIQLVTVPNVMNLSVQEAKDQLVALGFVPKIGYAYSNVIAKGNVISQSEDPYTDCQYGAKISLVVSSGVDPSVQTKVKDVKVPSFIGKSYQSAIDEAKKLGLTLSVSEKRYSSEYAENTIISQDISGGSTVKTGDTINLVISLGKEIIKVPDCQYKSESAAKATLNNLGLKVSTTYQINDSVSVGLVISQSPAANTTLKPGDTVKLVISKGSDLVTVPNVVGMTEANATSKLSGLGLNVSVEYENSDTAASGTVIKQNASTNSKMQKGSDITIIVSRGTQKATVPNVIGQAESSAVSILQNIGLNVSVIHAYNDTVSNGHVISQSPSVDTTLEKGSTVTISVSKGANSFKSISIKSKPTKTSYSVGDTLDTSGLTLNATYSDGSTQIISSGFTCNPTTLNSEGTQRITVSYGGKTTTFDVSVEKEAVYLVGLAIRTYPIKTSYYVGEVLNTSGLTLNAVYSDGLYQIISSGFSCTPMELNSAGTQTIAVSFEKLYASFTVTVNERSATLTGLSINTYPIKTVYYVGDTLDTSGLTLTATYSYGPSQIISSGFTCSPTKLNNYGSQRITVSYGGKTTSYTVSVQ